MKALAKCKIADFEQFGFDIGRETQCLQRAVEIGGLKMHEYRAEIQPDIDHLRFGISTKTEQKRALCAQIYDSQDPVSDKAMLAKTFALKVLLCILVGIALSSVAAHVYRLILFGLEILAALALGVVLTLAVAGVGHLAFEKLVRHSRISQSIAIGVSACLFFWGVFQLAQAGAAAVTKASASLNTSQSYVDGENAVTPSEPDVSTQTDEHHIQELISEAITKILLGADLGLGVLLGTVMLIWSDPEYVTWKRLAQLEKEIEGMKWRLNSLLASLEMAQRQCMAGILRFFYGQRKQHPSYFRAGAVCALLAVFAVGSANAQRENREEVILIDVSGSIGAGGANKELFKEYLIGARQLLMSEPPNSRVIVLLISRDSFGSGGELLKGRTPPARGVFTDELNRARNQLAAAFEMKTNGMSPIAAGTDIIGGLWRVKSLLETGHSRNCECEVWIFSDMMNETPALPMPALIATGPANMPEQAKKNGLIVPLQGYKIHVVGASTQGLSPQAWNAIKLFWTQYWDAAGAELMSYSEEAWPER